MKCKNCNSTRIAGVHAHCRDCCFVNIGDNEHEGYVPNDIGVGGGDSVNIDYCLDCGMIQGNFPIAKTKLETQNEE